MSPNVNRSSQKGLSLAKGPVGLLGLAGIAFGLIALIFGGHSFALRIPHGAVGDGHIFGLLTNGWTDLLFIAAGLLLLLSSSAHLLAKSSSFVVAGVMAAAAILAIIRGNGVFGIFAANGWTELIWAAAAVVLATIAWLPRVGRRNAMVSPNRTGAPSPVQSRALADSSATDTRV